MKIKSFIVFAVTLPVLFLINRCEDEKAVPRDYPRLNTFPVTNISDSGALVTGEIYAQGTQQILEYGFLWGKSELLLYGTNDMVILGAPQSTGSFTAFISSTLVKGTTYWVRPFARTTECIVYGNAISFTSLGSLAPLISGFYPDSAGWGDTITIRGKRLSWVPNKNVVKLNGITCYATRSTDTSVIVYVPNSLNIRESLLTVGIEGNTSTYNAKKFRLIMPELSDYNPKQARWGDTVLIKGKRLGTVNYSGNSVKFGTTNCSFIRVRDDSVWIKVPSEISTINNVLNLSINGITLTSGQSFQLLEPYFAFTPAEGTWGSRITLSGRFNAISSRNSFYINNSQAAVVSSNETKAEIIVPADLSSSASQIKYKATPFEINSVNKFVLLPPLLTSFSPSSGSYNQLITINGDRFGTVYRPVVKFGNVQAYVNSWSNTQITVYVPNTLYGPVKISVTSATQTVESATDFMIQNPHITGFTPQSGTFGDQITISGKYFVQGGTSVYINGYNASLISSTETEIIAKVPTQVDSIPNIVSISTIRGTSASATEKFTLLPPEIYSVSPLTLSPGGEVTITGNNFNTDSNKEFVFVDMVKLRITSATKTRIVAVAPAGLPRGSFRLKLQVNGYTRFSGSFVSINSQWLPIPSPMIRTTGTDNRPTVRIAAAGFSDRGYLCSLTDGGDTYRFDGNTKTWTKLSAKPAGVGGSMYNAKSVACNGSLFLVYGTAPVFTAFNPATESWTSINKNLGYNEYAATFALNNKIYFGTNAYLSGYPFYEIDPLNSFSMRNMTNFPVTMPGGPVVCFSLNNVGYALFVNNAFWKFDPVNNSWTKLSNFPGVTRTGAVSFVLGNYGYVAGGTKFVSPYNERLDDVWRYDASTDTWLRVSTMPNPREDATAFTLNGKAYIGYGLSSSANLYDFYEYDPNY